MSEDIKNQAAQMLRRIDNPTLQGQLTKIQNEDPMEEIKKDFLNGKTPKAFLTLLKSAKLKNFTIQITTTLFFYLTTRFNRVRLERSKHETKTISV